MACKFVFQIAVFMLIVQLTSALECYSCVGYPPHTSVASCETDYMGKTKVCTEDKDACGVTRYEGEDGNTIVIGRLCVNATECWTESDCYRVPDDMREDSFGATFVCKSCCGEHLCNSGDVILINVWLMCIILIGNGVFFT
ncbi:uncharacterized protein LOC144444686 [Glandiceps talaboti]